MTLLDEDSLRTWKDVFERAERATEHTRELSLLMEVIDTVRGDSDVLVI